MDAVFVRFLLGHGPVWGAFRLCAATKFIAMFGVGSAGRVLNLSAMLCAVDAGALLTGIVMDDWMRCWISEYSVKYPLETGLGMPCFAGFLEGYRRNGNSPT